MLCLISCFIFFLASYRTSFPLPDWLALTLHCLLSITSFITFPFAIATLVPSCFPRFYFLLSYISCHDFPTATCPAFPSHCPLDFCYLAFCLASSIFYNNVKFSSCITTDLYFIVLYLAVPFAVPLRIAFCLSSCLVLFIPSCLPTALP